MPRLPAFLVRRVIPSPEVPGLAEPRGASSGRVAWRPGPRPVVIAGAAAIVLGMAFVIAEQVADELRAGAMASALGNVGTIVRGFVDPVIKEESLQLDAAIDPTLDPQLERLALSGGLLQISVWSRDGRAVYSSNPVLRGQRVSIGHELATAFLGDSVAFREGQGAEATLRVLVPIRGSVDGIPIGVYDVAQDGRPIEEQVDAVRNEVFVTAVAAMSLLLGLLWIAFTGASRRLSAQNRLLREQAVQQEILTTDVRRSEERFRSLVRNASDTVLIVAEDGSVAYESTAVERMLGFAPYERVGMPLLDLLHPDDQFAGQRWLAEVRREPGAEGRVELRARHADGSWRVIEAVAKNLLDDAAVGGVVVNYRDITERKQLEGQLLHQAFHDQLTGLPNRTLFLDRLEHAWARAGRGSQPLAVIFLDLDDFKGINDALGHAAGDEALQVAAARIAACLGPGDTVARVGGDEFAVLIEDVPDGPTPGRLAERVLDQLRQPFQLASSEVTIRASAGIASARTTDEPDELLRNADIAMYQAKSQGKGRIVRYKRSMRDATLGRLQLKADLLLGLERGEFGIVYQPIVDLRTGGALGVEALLRWSHPRLGPIAPAGFVHLAEESGAIVPIGRWVLREATRRAREWQLALGRSVRMSVNLSARQLADPHLVDYVSASLAAAGLPAGSLVLEITEGALVDDVDGAVATLNELRRLGVRLAIDDFGTGYSSLNYLRQLPVDIIKIDRSFVIELGRSDAQRALLRSIVGLARTLRLESVAEGIETPGQVDELRALGVRVGQGFFFARPLPADQAITFLARFMGKRRRLTATSRKLRPVEAVAS
jgi:diguanylate cyclase (GGDEF)-like protein/PAS domain S-box-containing protein